MNLNIISWDIWKPNDWVTVEAENATWNIVNEYNDKRTEKCLYEIQFSQSRNTYRLKASGYDPKLHRIYPDIVRYFNNHYLKNP
jgi:hypothetical protein